MSAPLLAGLRLPPAGPALGWGMTISETGRFELRRGQDGSLSVDAEVAVEMGRDLPPGSNERTARAAVAGFGAALEVVDLGDAGRGAETVVANNVFHRAVAFGGFRPEVPTSQVEARLRINGTVRAAGPVPADLVDRVRAAARVLAAVDERLCAGDRLITDPLFKSGSILATRSSLTSVSWAGWA
jgi:hypothetical protein